MVKDNGKNRAFDLRDVSALPMANLKLARTQANKLPTSPTSGPQKSSPKKTNKKPGKGE